MRNLIFTLFVLAIFSGGQVRSETLCLDSDRQFTYASDLYSQKDYETAQVEFKRFVRFFPEDKRVFEARFTIGKALFDQGNPQQALMCFEELINDEQSGTWGIESGFMAAQCHMRTGNPVLGEICLKNLIQRSTDQALKDRAENALAWQGLETGQWNRARIFLGRISPEEKDHYKVDIIVDALSKTPDIPHKNPKLAGTLSIVPGAGFLYCGRYRDALVSFLLNGGLILAAVESFDHDHNALGGVITFVGFGFYAGNIYGSASSAHKFNRQADRDFISKLKNHISPFLSMGPGPDSHLRPGLALTGCF